MTGADLRETRKTAGLSMKQAAELSGTPYRTWQDWEGGKRRVPGIAFSWLLLFTEKKILTNCLFQMQEAAKQINGGIHGLEKTCSGSTGNEGKS